MSFLKKRERTHNMGLAIAGGQCLVEVQCSDGRHRQAPGRYKQA